ncbi:MAG: 16S rRNA (guanine(527)-N(7))-methyltransferase RsmG, partial [Oscillospiraceae bacterium]
MTDFHIEKITDRCAEFGVKIDREITERLNLYGNLLLEWNEKINLTAITAPEDVLYKHFYDCILFFKAVTPDKNAEIIDVGTGAGFPGMVLKIIRPDLKITLLDSLNKRLLFLNEVISQLGLQDISTVHMRAEDAGRAPAHREKYDIACARAVASLPILMEYCLPLVKKGGSFIAMKGASAAEEKALSLKAAG